MCLNKWTFDAALCAYDTGSITRAFDFILLNCSEDNSKIQCDWFVDCEDTLYTIPVSNNIPFFYQTHFIDILNAYPLWLNGSFVPGTPSTEWKRSGPQSSWFCKLEIYDACCNLLDPNGYDYILKSNVGRWKNRYFQNIQLDISLLPDRFQLKISTYDGREHYSPVYEKVCDIGIQLLGKFNKGWTNYGYFYGIADLQNTSDPLGTTSPSYVGDFFSFNRYYLSRGTSGIKSVNIEAEIRNNRKGNGSITNTYEYYGSRQPFFHIEELAEVLASREITDLLANITLNFKGSLEKKTSLGEWWTPEFELNQFKGVLSAKCAY